MLAGAAIVITLTAAALFAWLEYVPTPAARARRGA
jgi:hypothetical protein